MINRAVIAGYVRSPFSLAYKGDLKKIRPDELISQVIKKLIEKVKVNKDDIEDLILGCAFPEGEQGLNMARLVCFLSDLSISTAGVTINRFCGSSMQSIHNAAANIMCGVGDVYIAAGVESMSRVPMVGFNPMPHPKLFENFPDAYENMGITAENLAKKYKIKRKEQEEFALNSHQKSIKAWENNHYDEEVVPIDDNGIIIDKDGCLRGDASLENLAKLNPAFDAKGTVTAGTSSPLTDGGAAVLVCSEEYAKKNNLEILAYIKSFAVSGCEPSIMGIGPVSATKKAIKRAGIELEDIDIIELNEAFSVQALSVIKELSLDMNKINLDGGAISLGHPLGASGARITGKAALLLKKHNKKYALSTMCIGGGQGIATILEAA